MYRLKFLIVLVIVLAISISIYVITGSPTVSRKHQHESHSQHNNEAMGLKTHLPIISIETDGQEIPGEVIDHELIKYTVAPDGSDAIISDITVFEGKNNIMKEQAHIRYRGNSSRRFNKKSYSVRFVNPKQKEKEVTLMGIEKHDEWALHGPFLDRSLIRNYLAMNLAGEIMPYAPDVRFVEVIVNEEYQGVYVLMETISKGQGRVAIQTPEPNRKETSYIVEVDRLAKMDQPLDEFLSYTYKTYPSGIELIYPGKDQYSEEREIYVEQDFSQIAKIIYTRHLSERTEAYRQAINNKAFYDYFIINELFRNVDAGQYSTYFYKDLRGTLTPVVWDFNNALDNYQENTFGVSGFTLTNAIFYEALLKDDVFTDGLIKRYKYLRNEQLNEKRLLTFIDDTVLFLGEAISRNDAVYGYIYDYNNFSYDNYLVPVERNVPSHKAAIDQLKSYLVQRGDWLDKNINTLKQYSHPSRINHELIR